MVHAKPQHLFYERLNTSIKEKHVLPGFYHDTLGEKDKVILSIKCAVLLIPYLHNHFINMITNEDAWSHSADVYRALQTPLPKYCPKDFITKYLVAL